MAKQSTTIRMVSLIVVTFCVPAWALTYSTQYEMGADPSTGAGVIDGNGSDLNCNGLLTVSRDGSGSTVTTVSGNQVLEYNDNTSSGNLGYYVNFLPAPASTSFTVDLRVKVVSGVSG